LGCLHLGAAFPRAIFSRLCYLFTLSDFCLDSAAPVAALDPADGRPADAGGARNLFLCPGRVFATGLDYRAAPATAANSLWPLAPPSARCTPDPQAATPWQKLTPSSRAITEA
jgi:hypothetical protein